MIRRKDLLAMSFYEKSPFTGSDGNMNYRVEKITMEENSENEEEKKSIKLLQATVWPGPFCFTMTADEKKERRTAPFSEEGLNELVDWMNERAQFLKA